MTETDESFQAFLADRPAVGQAYVCGDSEPLAAISTAREPATFFSPSGGYVSGAAAVLATGYQLDRLVFRCRRLDLRARRGRRGSTSA